MPVGKLNIIIMPSKGIIRWPNEEKETHIIFGMSQADVERALGSPTQYTVNNLIHNVTEPRDGMQYIYDLTEQKDTALCYIDVPIGAGVTVTYQDIGFFEDNNTDVIAKLGYLDNPTPDNGKYINFYGLGICLGGYGKKRVPEKKFVRIFPRHKQQSMEMMFRTGGGKM